MPVVLPMHVINVVHVAPHLEVRDQQGSAKRKKQARSRIGF